MDVFTNYTCPRCGNKDPRYFGYKNGQPYCRLCIAFRGKEVQEYFIDKEETPPTINYPLSKEQQAISDALINNFKQHKSTLVHAVCGSGKTELVYHLISYALTCGYKVGFAVPRREVAIDLYPRFLSAFPKRKTCVVYGGHSDNLTSDIIVLTTHQLYRYNNYFDLLILDEIDAFPFKDNALLINFFNKAVKGNYVMMSATPPDDIVAHFKKNQMPILSLHTRYHRHPLAVPQVVIRIGYLKILYLIKKIKQYCREQKQVMIFVPSIQRGEEIFAILNKFLKRGACVHSKSNNRYDIIKNFKAREFDYLVTTSVLERGVTIANVQVIIYDADSAMYQKGVLIQIAGRVGRKINYPTGEVILLANKKSLAMQEAIDAIQFDNSFLMR